MNNMPKSMSQSQVAAMAAAMAAQQRIQQRIGAMAPKPVAMMPQQPMPPVQTEWTADVDINHSAQKALLTRSSWHQEVLRSTGAMVQLRGSFRKLGDTKPTKDQCLHLHLVGTVLGLTHLQK
mmetsp:Transcript_52113/g.84206  ORF Transcript_52113/g.84206 Transcript_52113/m.84206 type:complete len:122 (+) Transcript_52113:3-368(+)